VWSTADHSIISVESNGYVTGIATGTASVSAGYGFLLGSTSLVVTDAILVAITITPTNPAVARDGTIQLNAIGTFSDGNPFDITTQSSWSSSNDLIATVDSNGLVTGHSGGSCIIHVYRNGVTESKTLFVGN
jgi:uncharacterized protein YjdB